MSQKPRTDWGAALAFYVALGPEHRSARRVAENCHVTETTAKKHIDGRCTCCKPWVAIATAIDKQAAAKALAKAVKTREESHEQTLRIIDGYLDGFEADLETKVADSKASDLPGMVKLRELLTGGATERTDINPAQVQQVLAIVLELGTLGLPKGEFLARFDRAVAGVLGAGELEAKT